MDNPAAVLQQEVAESRRRAQEVVSGLVPEQLTRRPDSSKWSIAECIAHLNVTAGVVQPLIGKAIVARQERKPGGERTVQARKQRSAADLDCIATPPKFRMRAPKSVAPPVSIPEPGRLLEEFMRVQDDWERLWQDAEGLDLARINIGPRLSPFRCHVSASFPWMMAHQRRHLLQAENVKRQIISVAIVGQEKQCARHSRVSCSHTSSCSGRRSIGAAKTNTNNLGGTLIQSVR